MELLSLADARDRLSELIGGVERTQGRITITRHGQPAAVLISPEDLAALEETLDIVSQPGALEEIRQAESDIAAGDYVTGEQLADRYLHR